MAEVKLKNGYLRISVSLFENLYFRNFSKRELLIISLILRLSYGYHKKTAYIKPKTWFSVCGLYKQDINRILASLVDKQVIKDLGNNTYSLNKDYDEWLVEYPKNFDICKLNILKMLQDDSKRNTTENVSKILTNKVANNLQNSKQITTENEKVSETHTKNSVKNLPIKTDSKRNTTENVSKILTNKVANNLQNNSENKDGESDLNGSKNNKDNKYNNTNNIYNRNFDPYFNNPVVDKFKKEYERIFKTTRCYLDAIQINKLTEIGIDNPDFINKIPEILDKYKRIEFSNGINKFNLRGLINEGKWAAILNGEYDPYIKPENNSAEFDLGIPTER